VELYGKTLGIIGLGRIGRTVAQIAEGFNMHVIAYDPFVTPESVRDLELEVVSLADVFQRSDFISIHTPLTSETRGIIGAQAFSLMKRGVRIVNCARGGLVDETALYNAIREGIVAGAAIDVFEREPPPPDLPLLTLDEVIVTPHLGASTTEAQEGVAVTVAEQMRDYFLTGALRGAVNAPSLGTHELSVLGPYMSLAEKLGRVQAQLVEKPAHEVRLDYAGDLAELNSASVSRAFLAGFLSNTSDRVNVINSFLIAEERGVSVTTSYKRSGADYIHSIQTTAVTSMGQSTVAGTLFGSESGLEREGRITEIDGFRLEAIPAGHMLILYNKDLPGVIGKIGTVLGDGGVN
ncbi:MAG: NAD(P)-dependent oxidoreductase, partial [Pyrinomonadaceae bacterium]